MTIYHPRVHSLLEMAGIGPRLLQALDGEPILTMPTAPHGCGMAGTSGAGKTFAMVRHAATYCQDLIANHPNMEVALWPPYSFLWASWLQKSEELKRWLADHQHQHLEEWIHRAKTCDRFYMDDFGRERITGPNDFAVGVIREVVDYRHVNLKPVYWTTNLTALELADNYQDPALVGRLVEAWPPVKVVCANLRLREAPRNSA